VYFSSSEQNRRVGERTEALRRRRSAEGGRCSHNLRHDHVIHEIHHLDTSTSSCHCCRSTKHALPAPLGPSRPSAWSSRYAVTPTRTVVCVDRWYFAPLLSRNSSNCQRGGVQRTSMFRVQKLATAQRLLAMRIRGFESPYGNCRHSARSLKII